MRQLYQSPDTLNIINPYRFAASDFTYYSAVFEDNDRMTLDTTGWTDGKTGTVSCWFKTSSTGDQYVCAADAGTDLALRLVSAGGTYIQCGDTSGTGLSLELRSNTDTQDGSWHHIMASWDMSTGDTTKKHLYIDGADALDWARGVTDANLDYTNSTWVIGSRGDAFGDFDGTLCEFAFNDNYIDLSSSTNREKFRTSGGKPEDLGTGAATAFGETALVYLPNQVDGGTPDAFMTNDGDGGDFTEVGTITDGGSDKP